jgi:minichromosome maintenance protein 10
MFVGESIGREGQAKAQRQRTADADRALKSLLKRDREGMRTVMLAREANNASSAKPGRDEGKKIPSGGQKTVSCDGGELARPGKSAFSAQVVKQLGFDPTIKPGSKKQMDDNALLKKVKSPCIIDSVMLLNFKTSFNHWKVLGNSVKTLSLVLDLVLRLGRVLYLRLVPTKLSHLS